MSDQTKRWLIGLLNAGISGAATVIGTQVAGTTIKQTAIAAGVAAVVSLAKWVFQHPLPGASE